MPILKIESEASVDLYYEDHGVGDPVVLIHGWPLSGRSWEPQVRALVEAGRRVITYDRRGFGWSSQPWEGYDYDRFTADLDALMTHLDLHNVALVGFSMGGGEVVRYLGRYGSSRVSCAVLASAVPPYLYKSGDNPDGGLDDAKINTFLQDIDGDRPAFLDEFFNNFFSVRGEAKVSKANMEYAAQIARFASAKGTRDCLVAFARTDFRSDLDRIDVPTLVMHGDSDAIVPFEVSGKRSAELIKNSKLVVLKDAPHGCNVSHASKFNAELLSFVSETARQQVAGRQHVTH
ncbi:MAG: alpha/beta hydrolase [Thermoleophilia bacterium]|nr:alpha/beta hydrolase [Thermoleophilia bacterium]